MTIAMNNPMKSRPVLRLKSSASPLAPAPIPTPTPPPRPAPAAEPLAAGPPSISKKAARKIAAANMRRELVLKFPECFKGYGVKRPLKIKIHEDILAVCPGFDRRTLSDALRSYVSRGGYRECLIAGATRVALDGSDAGVVTDDQVQRPKTITPEKE
jgi:hypothetical protein